MVTKMKIVTKVEINENEFKAVCVVLNMLREIEFNGGAEHDLVDGTTAECFEPGFRRNVRDYLNGFLTNEMTIYDR